MHKKLNPIIKADAETKHVVFSAMLIQFISYRIRITAGPGVNHIFMVAWEKTEEPGKTLLRKNKVETRDEFP